MHRRIYRLKTKTANVVVMAKLIDHFEYRIAMSGTPNSNTIQIFEPALLVDDGQRLGKRLRSQDCM